MTKAAESFENTVAVGGLEKESTDNAFERETTITFSDGEDVAYITTSQRTYITKLLKNPAFTITSDQAASKGNPRVVIGTLDTWKLLTIRQGKGEVKRTNATAPTHLSNVVKCGAPKADGTACQMVAKKETGKCRWHS